MDLVSILRTLGGLATVLGILSGALWLVRRYDIRLPGRTGMLRVSRLELIEKLPLDARRSVALLRRDGREHLILIAPEGHLIIESGLVRDAVDLAAQETAEAALSRDVPQFRDEIAAAGESFGALVEHIRERAAPAGRTLKTLIGRATAFAAPAPPTPPAAPVPVRSGIQPKRTRKPVRKARAARKGLHHA